jgi:hypothetical protein
MRMEIQILQGFESFKECVERICFAPVANAGASVNNRPT